MNEKCPICKRELGQENIDEHHLVPKCKKGKDTVPLHKICHRKIHATFTEKELQQHFNTVERLLESEEIQRFVKWVSKKPSAYYDCSAETSSRKNKRKR